MSATGTREHVVDLIGKTKTCMFTTMTDDGRHHSRPMAVQSVESDGDLWFFTYEDSDKVSQVRNTPEVNVAFSDDSSWVSVAGRAEVVHDHDKAEELWNPLMKAWFPDGVETDGLSLLRVRADSAEYWDTPSSKIATAVSLAKSVATGKTAGKSIGSNEATDL